jgi:hypothetical protein
MARSHSLDNHPTNNPSHPSIFSPKIKNKKLKTLVAYPFSTE